MYGCALSPGDGHIAYYFSPVSRQTLRVRRRHCYIARASSSATTPSNNPIGGGTRDGVKSTTLIKCL